ncbi:MAG: DUF2442 domain-containing protein [Chloroflexi bacterium]|nr:DUF2442 domain-containing protein [Chloroflexota bacterium]
MTHQIYRIINFEIVAPFTLRIEFDDNAIQEIDFWPVLKGLLYQPLQDQNLFEQVKIDPEVHTLVWPNGADFDPETLHNWPKYSQTMIQMANSWPQINTEVI